MRAVESSTFNHSRCNQGEGTSRSTCEPHINVKEIASRIKGVSRTNLNKLYTLSNTHDITASSKITVKTSKVSRNFIQTDLKNAISKYKLG